MQNPETNNKDIKVVLSKIKIPLLNDQTIEIDGTYTFDEIYQLLEDHWIISFDCKHCGRSSYCKYVIRHSKSNKIIDRKCGITSEILKNYLNAFYETIIHYSKKELEQFFFASYNYIRFVDETETHFGELLDGGLIDRLDKVRQKTFLSMILTNREYLNNFASLMRGLNLIPIFNKLVLVEGESEEKFLNILRPTLNRQYDFEVVTYTGKDKKRIQQVEIFIKHLSSKGYLIYFQGELDGKGGIAFEEHKKRFSSVIGTFAFSMDFESSFPLSIVYKALSGIMKVDFEFEELYQVWILQKNVSVVKILEKHFDLKFNKPRLAECLAFELIDEHGFLDKSKISGYEIDNFLNWIMDIPTSLITGNKENNIHY